MKNVNKKIFVIVLSGFILITGCSNKIEPREQIKQETPKAETKNEEKAQISSVSNKESKKTPEIITDRDKEVLNYFNDIKNNIDTEEVKEEAIKKFITMTDFIFYDGEIKGIKFNDLKEETKNNILEIYYTVDTKIENKFPNYKDKIDEKYNSAKEYLKQKYDEISQKTDDKLKENMSDETYNNFKESASEIMERDKEVIDKTKDAAKDTYDKTKTKVKDWYQNLKNNH